ncbi:MAG: site-2 protease family protein [Dehalococcoidia bacterium]|nr:site-2 protease family protein [Dehalococcoidia bacterium]
MLLGSYRLLADDPSGFFRLTVLILFALVTAVTIHEFSHAFVANTLGDNTARRLGRLSLNPIRHLDPGGAIMMFIAGFGWGKPVPVDQHQLSRGHTDTALVAAAGPLSNLMFAFLLAIPFKTGILVPASLSLNRVAHVMTGGLSNGVADILAIVIFFNLLLGVFNLVPLAPLDGSRVLSGFVPSEHLSAYNNLQRSGPGILVAVIMLDFVLGLGILWGIVGPVIRALTTAATGY